MIKPAKTTYTGPRLQSVESGLMIGASLHLARREDQPGISNRRTKRPPFGSRRFFYARIPSINGGGARGHLRMRRFLLPGFDLPLRPPPHPSEDQLTVAAIQICNRCRP